MSQISHQNLCSGLREVEKENYSMIFNNFVHGIYTDLSDMLHVSQVQ